jgi:2,5-diketo-D-gluconate reductase B
MFYKLVIPNGRFIMPELQLPKMGFGTWALRGKVCTDAVLKAIEVGYRFIDTAQHYKNEVEVGEAIATCGVPRDDLIIATKVWPNNLGYENVLKTTEISLKKLGLPTVDILYVHWPTPLFYRPKKTLAAFNKLVDDGKVRYIGISNFSPKQTDTAVKFLAQFNKPVIANQILHHPMKQQRVLRDYLQKKDIYLVAYSPLAQGGVFKQPVLQEIATRLGVSPGQVALAWIMDHAAIPIPKATGEAHIRADFEAQDLKLPPEDVAKIDGISRSLRSNAKKLSSPS